MSILIKDMKMPKNCDVCFMCDACEYSMPLGKRLTDCPLVEVTTPHGRLIDADALVRDNGIKEIPEYYEVVCDAPTIIPAEESKEK